MQLSEMINEVLRRLGEDASSPVYCSRDDVKDAINEGLEEIADATEFAANSYSFPVVDEQAYYSLSSVLSRDVLLVTSMFNPTARRHLSQVSVELLDSQAHPRWQLTVGQPRVYFIRDIDTLGLYPAPAANDTFTIEARVMPNALSSDTDAPTFPEVYHPALISYALYTLLAEDGEFDEALMHYAEYKRYEERIAAWAMSKLTSDRTEALRVPNSF